METRAQRATWLFTAFVALVALVACVAALRIEGAPGRPLVIGWIPLALAFALSERYSVVLEVRREAQSLTFSEIPLVVGLLFTDADELILARIVGAGLALAFVRKLPAVKVLFNVALFAVEVGVALLVFHAVLGDGTAIEPTGWIAATAAVLSSHFLNWLLVTGVLYLAGAPITVRSALNVLTVSSGSAMAGCAVALGAGAALWTDGRSWVLLFLIGLALGYFFLSFVRIRERHQSLALLHTFTTSLEATRSAPELARAAVVGIAELLSARRVVVVLPTDGGFSRLTFADGDVVSELAAELQDLDIPLLLATKSAHQTAAVMGDDHEEHLPQDSMVARMTVSGGDGVVIVDGRESDARGFDDEDQQLLETAAGHASAALSSAALVDELRAEATFRARQALHDEVTDLPNSRGLAETLYSPLLAGSRLAILTIRIDSLREVNETLGRAMGDELLQQAAARLSPLTETGWCAKTATDEFTIVVRGGYDEAQGMAEQVIHAFDAPVLCADVALAITAGIGIVLAPDHGRETEILLRRASLAASRSRVEGTKVTTWAADRDPYDPQRLAIAADLRDAIPAGELQVHFQPQVDIESGLVTGAEALVRWRHPRLGELRPDQFIAAAEYTGAIDALTEHVLSVATQTCATWRQQGWDLDVSVNLSARNLANLAFSDLVERVLEDTGLDPSALTLELTESSIMTEAEGAMSTLAAIHDLGVSLSIDDFGTGYSSLAHLRKLPVSEIKIDKSFVFDLTTSKSDEAIVRSMVDLGHHLGLTVVVEGVETVEVRRRLADMGADRIQGYLLSRPMPVAAFEQWIADRPVRMAELSTSEAEADAPSRIEDLER
jgi:diguanylate cyclase (GGDEF)-like protein